VTLNKIIQSLIRELIQIEVSGKKLIKGTIIDLGSDIIVLFNGADYVYIPFNHIQSLSVIQKSEFDILDPTELPGITTAENEGELSLQDTLIQAIGKNVEIYITNDQLLHGRITRIKDDYFEFYSPIYQTMYISINHLKWLIPYSQSVSPYGLDDNNSIKLTQDTLASTFEAQVEKFKDKMVVLNIGGNKSHIGKIKNVEVQIVEMQRARTAPIYLTIAHIKTLHQV
jgi:ribosome maturation factor RimP